MVVRPAETAEMSGRNILILRSRASLFAVAGLAGRSGPDDRFALVGAACLRRPAAVPAGARRGSRRRVRAWFAARDFVEVETAILQVSPGNEAHLHAFATELIGAGRARARRSICTPRRNSPARSCWRPASRGCSPSRACSATASAAPLHHPEFTMLEWYRANEPYDALIEDCAALLAAGRRGGRDEALRVPRARGRSVRRSRSGSRSREAFARLRRHRSAGDRRVRPTATRWPPPRQRQGIRVAADDTWADVFSRVLVERIEPNLGIGRATILDEYPVSRSRAGAADRARSARRRALRALCLRRRARQRLRRTDRSGRAAPPLRERDGREGARVWRALSDRRGFPRRARARCRRPPASRSASTGW